MRDYGNRYYRVTEPTTAYLLVAHFPGNCYYGASRIYGNVYEKVVLRPGDEIYKLVGGTFIHTNGSLYAGSHRVRETGTFVKSYGPPEDYSDWAPEVLMEIERVPFPGRPEIPAVTMEWAIEHGKRHANSDDYVIDRTKEDA